MALKIRSLAVAGALAGTTMFAAPASAAALPATGLGAPSAVFDHSRYNPASATADWGCRWNCGWGHRRGWRRNRVGAGDVLIGAAIIGGIAAIASSNNRRQRDRDVVIVERDVRDREWRDDNRRYDDRRTTTPRSSGAAGLDNAVNQCLTRIERDVRVDTVDNVDRTSAGWIVSGALFNGSPFQCRIGNSGQIDDIDYGGGFSGIGYSGGAEGPAPRGEGQWDDQRYATARMAVGGSVRPDLAVQEAPMSSAPMQVAQGQAKPVVTDRMPAYPGGPIPGEEIPETIDGDL
jgi:hypothetical protein